MADDDEDWGEDDPDYILKNPPEEQTDPSVYFKTGIHDGKWTEWDDKGIPTKNDKKKKLAKKEIEAVTTEWQQQKAKFEQYQQDVENWKQRQIDAEAALEKTDRLRWCFRQLGDDKNEPIGVSEVSELFAKMGWDMTKNEIKAVEKDILQVAEDDETLGLKSLRDYIDGGKLSHCMLDLKMRHNEIIEYDVVSLYSPRSWRKKLDEEDAGDRKKKKKKDDASPRSPKEKKDKKEKKEGKEKKDKKDKKEKKDKKKK